MSNSFFRIYFLAFLHPRKSLTRLLDDQRYLSKAPGFIVIPAVAYTLMYVLLHIGNGAPSVFTPWLNIPKDQYYAVNRWLVTPSMFLSWISSVGFMQLLAKGIGGRGSYEQTLAAIALSIGVAMWGGLIHDLPVSFLSAINVIDARQHEIAMNTPTIWRTLLWICYTFYGIAFVVMFTISIKAVHALSWAKSISIGIPGFALFQVIFLIFNR